MKLTVTILGASGSIGTSAIEFLRIHRQTIALVGVCFRSDWQAALRICSEFGCKVVSFSDCDAARTFKKQWNGKPIEVIAGPDAATELAAIKVDVVLAAISGAVGLNPVIAAISAGNRVALANKEALVCGGPLLVEYARQQRVSIVPVDSEHSAIFQALLVGKHHEVASLLLTASGGPFRTAPFEQMKRATREAALAHPNWKMGAKNSIDSATLANKGLELIEASYLFGFHEQCIDVLINPSSIVHSAVGYRDGTMIAQMGNVDMRAAIGYGITWPDRVRTGVPNLSLSAIGKLEFEDVDLRKFKALPLARQALNAGSDGPLLFNFADEVAVEAFLEGKISLTDIATVIEICLERGVGSFAGTLTDLDVRCREARKYCGEMLNEFIDTASSL